MSSNLNWSGGRRLARRALGATAVAALAVAAAVVAQPAAAAETPQSIWTTTAASKASVDLADASSVELGTAFTATADGVVSGVKFWKTADNKGTHVGSLWTSAGARLSKATFVNETTSGWQTVKFATPVKVTKGASYVASYLAPRGKYAYTQSFTGTSASPSLTIPSTNVGRYAYGTGSFPKSTYKSTNYWVDVLFTPTTTTTAPAPAPTTTAPAPTPTATTAPAPTPTPTATTAPAPTPTPTATTAPAPTPTPTATTAPAPAPTTTPGTAVGTARPGPTTTGVPAGTTLKASGGFTVTTANTVIDGMDISGAVYINAPGVVIKNSRIHGSGSGTGVQTSGSGSVTIFDSEIYGFENAIGFDSWKAYRVNVHSNTGDGVKFGSDVVLQDSWIHDLKPGAGAHADGGQVQYGVVNLVIRHNVIDLSTTSSANAALFIAPDLGGSTNGPVTVDNNYLAGGNYTVFCVDGNNGQYFIGNISFTNNTFGRGAAYGPVRVNVPVTWTNNTWADNGSAITL